VRYGLCKSSKKYIKKKKKKVLKKMGACAPDVELGDNEQMQAHYKTKRKRKKIIMIALSQIPC